MLTSDPPELEDVRDRDRRPGRHPDAEPARRPQRDEPRADRRAHHRRGLARRPRPDPCSDHHRRRAGLLRRRRRQLVQAGASSDESVDLPSEVRRGAEVAAPGDRRHPPHPLSGDRRRQRPGRRRRLLAGALCDIRIASEAAFFAIAYGRIGAAPDGGMTYFLPRVVGPAKALELALDDPNIDAEAALEAGLVTRGRPGGRAARRAPARRPTSWPRRRPHYVRMTKRLLRESASSTRLTDHLQLERHGIADSMGTTTCARRHGVLRGRDARRSRATDANPKLFCARNRVGQPGDDRKGVRMKRASALLAVAALAVWAWRPAAAAAAATAPRPRLRHARLDNPRRGRRRCRRRLDRQHLDAGRQQPRLSTRRRHRQGRQRDDRLRQPGAAPARRRRRRLDRARSSARPT